MKISDKNIYFFLDVFVKGFQKVVVELLVIYLGRLEKLDVSKEDSIVFIRLDQIFLEYYDVLLLEDLEGVVFVFFKLVFFFIELIINLIL